MATPERQQKNGCEYNSNEEPTVSLPLTFERAQVGPRSSVRAIRVHASFNHRAFVDRQLVGTIADIRSSRWSAECEPVRFFR